MPDNLTASEVEELKRIIDGYESTAGIPWPSDWTRVLSALPALLRAWEDRNKDRCSECNGELSACGDMTSDGPRMDCKVCQLLARAETAEREWNIYKSSNETNLRELLELVNKYRAVERERDAVRAECERLKANRDRLVELAHANEVLDKANATKGTP